MNVSLLQFITVKVSKSRKKLDAIHKILRDINIMKS